MMSLPARRYSSVDAQDHVGLRQLQQVVVALQVLRVVGEARAAVLGLAEPAALDHRAHRAVEDDDALLQDVGQPDAARIGCRVHAPIVETRPRAIPRCRMAASRSTQYGSAGMVSLNSESRKLMLRGPTSSIAHRASALADIGLANR